MSWNPFAQDRTNHETGLFVDPATLKSVAATRAKIAAVDAAIIAVGNVDAAFTSRLEHQSDRLRDRLQDLERAERAEDRALSFDLR